MKFSTSAKLHSRINKEGKRAVSATYTFDKETTPFATGLSVADEHWDAKKKLAIVGTPDALQINLTLQEVQTHLLAIAESLATPTHELLKRHFISVDYQRTAKS